MLSYLYAKGRWWRPAEEGNFKMNFDRAIFTEKNRAAGIIGVIVRARPPLKSNSSSNEQSQQWIWERTSASKRATFEGDAERDCRRENSTERRKIVVWLFFGQLMGIEDAKCDAQDLDWLSVYSKQTWRELHSSSIRKN